MLPKFCNIRVVFLMWCFFIADQMLTINYLKQKKFSNCIRSPSELSFRTFEMIYPIQKKLYFVYGLSLKILFRIEIRLSMFSSNPNRAIQELWIIYVFFQQYLSHICGYLNLLIYWLCETFVRQFITCISYFKFNLSLQISIKKSIPIYHPETLQHLQNAYLKYFF